jgi:CheY-like chemotaxis protein
MAKILVIEDEGPIRNNLERLLRAEGYAVVTAENGVLGVRAAARERPDLVLCDVLMPEMDGYGVLAALRQSVETARIPFIFLTASADRADRRLALEHGADEYITKPFKLQDVLAAIKRRLSGAAAGD